MVLLVFSLLRGVCTSKSIDDIYSKFLICHTEKILPQKSSVSKDYFPKSSIVRHSCNFECIEARCGTFKNINWLIWKKKSEMWNRAAVSANFFWPSEFSLYSWWISTISFYFFPDLRLLKKKLSMQFTTNSPYPTWM